MFFKKTVLKRMLKSAYTGAGLTVGHTPETDEEEEGYYPFFWLVGFMVQCGNVPERSQSGRH